MNISLGSWFNQPKINFKFSHKVDLAIRNEISNEIMTPLGLHELYPDKWLHLNVTTIETQDKLEVKLGSNWSERTTSRNHGLWFPYHKIVNSDYPLKEYLKYYIESLPIIFNEYGITDEQVLKVKTNCENKILNNTEFELTQEELNEIYEEENLADEITAELGL